ncbi:adhesin, partial [Escherichia coli]
VSVGKAAVGGVTSAAVNGGFQWYGLSQPGSENQSWDYKGSASSFMTGMLAPGRTVTANTAIALGGSVFSDGANIKSQSGTALGAYAGGYVGEYFPVILRPVLGNSASTVGDIGGGFVSELINYGIKNYPTPTNKEPEHE